ncbi:hypothetical protein TPB0596_29870 [Tsukamurella pulmonis]|uniref:hypothetical protein n=1 Tax=Tsukamurella pulmonis TaxID=47312 RepID=UPI001EDE70B3|nr:hypothetical protein [Tsukamurella pulmonis]BDD83224.1 hypothetical protein TPB0596_29870 [Tsukamurella pulmonis]
MTPLPLSLPTARRAGALALAALTLATSAACGSPSPSQPEAPEQLVGLFRFTPGGFADGKPTGTYFKMAIVGGTADGPFVNNANSPVDEGRVTALHPGTAGGLRTGAYQSEAKPGFAGGDSRSGSVITPTKFFDVLFGISTNAVDPQTRAPLPAPSVTRTGTTLTADVSAWAASWNNQEFNQGAPKPVPRTDAAAAGQEQVARAWDVVSQRWLAQPAAAKSTGPAATGTFDAATRRFTLDWTSHIQGGPFNDFTGVWHLEGVFEPGPPPSAAPSGSPAPVAPKKAP